jgi:hypothetical protein
MMLTALGVIHPYVMRLSQPRIRTLDRRIANTTLLPLERNIGGMIPKVMKTGGMGGIN